MSISTWMLVPACAGSTPILARQKGRPEPSTTEVITIAIKETEIAQELRRLPFVMYTRANPAAASPPPSSKATSICSVIVALMDFQLVVMLPVACCMKWQMDVTP
eukprot:GHRQ01027665.1.p2 GENE.GHRQ01027665.1~~GHRQ01027665.1.p2  ORF type:complete len:105 (-),score=1.13 GHRQ01027665.1:876-1190(-)